MFLRFVSTTVDDDAHVRLGIFHAAYELRDSGRLHWYEYEWLLQVFHWFNENLERPTRFCRSLKPRRQSKAVCWFRPSAAEHLERVWEMIAILENNDIPIYMIKTERPGYVVYEDVVQVVAEPFIDLKRQEWR